MAEKPAKYGDRKRDPASNQLLNFKLKQKVPETILTSWGAPRAYQDASKTIGREHGPILMEDNELLDEIAHFNRERIPERAVHAKGAGAFGTFEVTHDITQYCAAKIFSHVGKRTPMAVRFSQFTFEKGYADTVRDTRGMALKFYTEDGVWDLVGNSTPVFFVRDPALFPSFIHTQKRNPITNLRDWDAYWDFASLRPECIHQYLFMYGDRGIPASYRNMHGYGINTFKLINSKGETVWCKFHYKTDQGIKNLAPCAAERIAGSDPDFYVRDLYNAIENCDYPSWTLYIQVMTVDEAQHVKFNPFDITKVWPQAEFPLIPVGKFTLNKNPSNYFTEVEQMALTVSNLVPGIGSSPDKMLQARLFAYSDTQRYRMGTNFAQLSVNSPYGCDIPKNYQRDGKATIVSQNGAPNYHPNSFCGPEVDPRAQKLQPPYMVHGEAYRFDTGDDDNYSQPRVFYQRVLDEAARQRLVDNIAVTLSEATDFLQERVIAVLSKIDTDFGARLSEALKKRQCVAKLDLQNIYIS